MALDFSEFPKTITKESSVRVEQQKTRRRLSTVRIGLAVVLFSVVLWGVAPWFTHRISSSAVINAEIIRYASPIPGIADPALPEPGRVLAAGSELPLVTRLITDERDRLRAQAELAQVRSRISRARDMLRRLAEHEEEVVLRGHRLQAAVSEVIAAETDEARANYQAALARIQRARADLTLAEDMRARGLWSPVRVEAARVALVTAEAEAETAAARLRRLDTEQRALLVGARLRDGYNDVPYNQQQLDRIFLLRENVLDRLAEAEAQEESLTAALLAEEEAQRTRRRYAPSVSADLVVLRRHVTPGSPIQPGTVVADLINCQELFVEVALPDRAFRDVAINMPAEIVLSGGLRLEGKISALRGGASRREEPLLAADFPRPPHDHMIVRIALPADAHALLTREQGRHEGAAFCGVGRFAEVLIPTSYFAALTDGWTRLNLWVRDGIARLRALVPL